MKNEPEYDLLDRLVSEGRVIKGEYNGVEYDIGLLSLDYESLYCWEEALGNIRLPRAEVEAPDESTIEAKIWSAFLTQLRTRSEARQLIICQRCGHKWFTRVPVPIKCPNCQGMLARGPK